jgi:hypothetical protein
MRHQLDRMELSERRSAKIPAILPNIRVGHKFRFITIQLLGEYAITGGDLCQLLCVLLAKSGGIGATSSWMSAFSQCTLRSVEMWAPSVAGASTEVLLNWEAGGGNLGKDVSDSSMNPAVPAHVYTRPPPLSPANFPQPNNSTQPLFYLSCPSGTIIDITLSTVVADGHTTRTFNEAYTGSLATVGTINAGPLDAATSIANATTPKIIAVGLHPVNA